MLRHFKPRHWDHHHVSIISFNVHTEFSLTGCWTVETVFPDCAEFFKETRTIKHPFTSWNSISWISETKTSAAVWSLDAFKLYANPAGLTGTFSHCTSSSRRRHVGIWMNICPASVVFQWQDEPQPAERAIAPRFSPTWTRPSRFSSLLRSFSFGHSCRKFASHRPGFSRGFKNRRVSFFQCFTSMWKRAEVLHLCEIWNISSKYIKAQCLSNVFRIQGVAPRLFPFSVSGHAVNRCMFLFFSCDPVLFVQKQSNKDYIWLERWAALISCVILRWNCLWKLTEQHFPQEFVRLWWVRPLTRGVGGVVNLVHFGNRFKRVRSLKNLKLIQYMWCFCKQFHTA